MELKSDDDTEFTVEKVERSNFQLVMAVIGASIGNLMEWFDFAMFGLLAHEIGTNFFPHNSGVELLYSFGVFAGAFFMRPLGGVLFGYIGDKYGRITALRISLYMMAIPTFLTGCLPNYATIGVAAPILLTIFRLTQGISVGGEFTGGITYMLEVCPPQNKVFYNTLVDITACGTLFGSLFVGLLRVTLTQQQMDQYGWRIPFWFGVIVAIFGIWMRTGLQKSEEFMSFKASGMTLENPTKEVLKHHKLTMFVNVLYLSFGAAYGYTTSIWVPDYVYNKEINPIRSAYLINGVNIFIGITIQCLSAWMVDKHFNSDPTFTLIFFGLIASIYTLIIFPFLNEVNTVQFLFIQMGWAVIGGMYSAGWSIWAIMRFGNNTIIRYSGFAIGYNISLALFGGTAPLIATVLVFYYNTWTVGILLFAYGIVSVATTAICYCTKDKLHPYKNVQVFAMSDPSELAPLTD